MSKIGIKNLIITNDICVQINFDLQIISVQKISEELNEILLQKILIIYENNEFIIFPLDEHLSTKQFFGLFRSICYNIFQGIFKNWSKLLIIEGIGYKFVVENNKLNILAGLSHKVSIRIPTDIKVSLISQSRILINSPSKVKIGSFTTQIKNIKKPEPYGGKGIRFESDIIIRKIGKKEKKSRR